MPDLKVIKRNSNDFSFIETVASLVNNKEYRSGYQDLIEGKTNDKTYFWTALSAVGEEIGEVLYENVLNYVNNAANINTCRLKPLTSIARVLGVSEFSILKNIDAIPLDIKNLMDIFSINKAYLLNINNFNSDFVKDLISTTLDTETIENLQLSSMGETLSSFASTGYFLSGSQEENVSALNVFGSISEEKYRKYVEECFFQLLSKKLFQSYDKNDPNDLVYTNLSTYDIDDLLLYDLENIEREKTTRYRRSRNAVNTNEIEFKNGYSVSSSTSLYSISGGIDIPYREAINNYKRAFNIDRSFNQKKIVDDIENGLDFLDNYSGGKLSVLTLEIKEREKTRYNSEKGYSSNLVTRYSYYNESEVLDYLRFINDTVLLYDLKSYSEKDLESVKASYLTWSIYLLSNTFSIYNLDKNYSELTLSNNFTLQKSIDESYSQYVSVKGDVPFADFVHDFYEKPYDYDDDPQLSATVLSANAVRTTAMILRDICFAIVDIREKLKMQSQRNYMTGTKLLIEYILEEYVADYLINSCGFKPEEISLNQDKFSINIQEYNDGTEYFNNNRFFSNLKGDDPGSTANTQDVGLGPLDIRKYYLDNLNIDSHEYPLSDVSENYYYDFMSAVYELGQPKSIIQYDGEEDSLKIVLDDSELTSELILSFDVDKVSSEHNFTQEDYKLFKEKSILKNSQGFLSINYDYLNLYLDSISSEISTVSEYVDIYNFRLSSKIDEQNSIALSYGGKPVCYFPWYNYKNVDYATYQSHPYLYNFTEHNDLVHPIENAFYGNSNEDLIYELQSQNISVYLEQYGNIRRIWRNSIYDYSGYRSRYENYIHTSGPSNSNLLYSLQHYDGIFYPPAIELYKKYWKNEINDPYLNLSGFDLLSAHMLLCVDEDCYEYQTDEDILTISSMWHYYSHIPYLKNRKEERQHVVEQLIGLSNYLLSVSSYEYRSDNNIDPKPHDVYRYGLDYLDNSIILLKHYVEDDPSYDFRKNTTGELWLRYNAHPIAFPAFLPSKLSSLQQFVVARDQMTQEDQDDYFPKTEFNNALYNDYFKVGKIPEIYDFNLDESGNNLVFAVKNDDFSSYKHSLTYSSKLKYADTNKLGKQQEERVYYFLEKYGDEKLSANEDYEFNGYFNTNRGKIYLGYLKKTKEPEQNSLLSVEINVIEAPGTNAFKYISNPIDFSEEQLSIPHLQTSIDDQCVLGYTPSNVPTFSLVSKHSLNGDSLSVQNLVGFVSVSSDIEKEKLGKTEMIFESGENIDSPSKEYNSFDSFSEYILIHSIKETYLEKNTELSVNPNVYCLNSDASYVPQYSGLDGQNLFYLMKNGDRRVSYNYDWHNENKVPEQSIELLGYSFQELDNKINNKEVFLHESEDSNGIITDVSENALLCTTLRVYEDFELSNYIFNSYNEGYHYIKNSGKTFSITMPIDIPNLNANTISSYSILLLNSNDGKNRNPILAGPLSEETVSKPVYNVETTEDEQWLLSVGFRPDKRIQIVGTPNPFDAQNNTFALDYSNHIFNISGLESKLVKSHGKYSIKLTFHVGSDINFVLQTGILHLMVYLNTKEEFSKYHYMEPFGRYPYNAELSAWQLPWKPAEREYLYLETLSSWSWSEISSSLNDMRVKDRLCSVFSELYSSTVSSNHVIGHIPASWYREDSGKQNEIKRLLSTYNLMDNIELSSVVSFDEVYELSSGQITWKISEEDEFDYNRHFYPPTEIDNILYSRYGDTNKSSNYYSVFSLSNTYIFQLEDPERIAERISKVAVPIGSTTEQFHFVYEDYLSNEINVDVGSKEFLHYQEFFYDLSDTNIPSGDFVIDEGYLQSAETIIENAVDKEAALCGLAEKVGLYQEDSEKENNDSILDYQIISVNPDDIAELLKVYVNWRKYKNEANPEQEEIELFFNLPNLFMTPYSYRNKYGTYIAEYKKNTYVRIKSGKSDYLYITLQLKYYDMTGTLCGTRDLPILTYQIFNVSDDKPKFIITKTYEIDNRDGRYLYPDANGNSKVYILVNSKQYSFDDIDSMISYDYTLNENFFASTSMQVISQIPLQYLNVEMLYERGRMANNSDDDEPEFVFEPTISKPGKYSENKGIISVSFDSKTVESDLEFTLLAGTTFDETVNKRYFPIEILNADAIDINGNVPEFVFINGGILFDDTNSSGLKTGAYLARELNFNHDPNTGSFMGGPQIPSDDNSRYFAGWINEETQRALFRLYNIGRASNEKTLVAIANRQNYTLKTSGTKESRFDSKKDRPIRVS